MNSGTAQALVLDFGGVMTKTMFETHAHTEAALGLEAGALAWRGPFAPETDPLWQMMQNDEISERDYWLDRTREVGQLVGKRWSRIEDFIRQARGADPEAVIRPRHPCSSRCGLPSRHPFQRARPLLRR